jgi:hypothetical protein
MKLRIFHEAICKLKLRDATNNLLSIADPDDIKALKKEI